MVETRKAATNREKWRKQLRARIGPDQLGRYASPGRYVSRAFGKWQKTHILGAPTPRVLLRRLFREGKLVDQWTNVVYAPSLPLIAAELQTEHDGIMERWYESSPGRAEMTCEMKLRFLEAAIADTGQELSSDSIDVRVRV
jgi:hypothetical protein